MFIIERNDEFIISRMPINHEEENTATARLSQKRGRWGEREGRGRKERGWEEGERRKSKPGSRHSQRMIGPALNIYYRCRVSRPRFYTRSFSRFSPHSDRSQQRNATRRVVENTQVRSVSLDLTVADLYHRGLSWNLWVFPYLCARFWCENVFPTRLPSLL